MSRMHGRHAGCRHAAGFGAFQDREALLSSMPYMVGLPKREYW